jgi:tRNA U34 5-methylaminomethyl-2-thiouridine-forming methyltransferase MnmC
LNIKIINTSDGSNTVYNKDIDECYHSTFGAISESVHIFIDNGLEKLKLSEINVFEIGFGTGLNAFLSAIYAQSKSIKINYYTIEKHPLDSSTINSLNYFHQLANQEIYNALHLAEWNKMEQISPFFLIYKLNQDLIHFDFKQIESPDIVFFDAFSPSKQPEMWQPEIFEKIYNSLNINGILLTYTAAGIVKKSLRKVGFHVKRLKGPPGKHHMLMAQKI